MIRAGVVGCGSRQRFLLYYHIDCVFLILDASHIWVLFLFLGASHFWLGHVSRNLFFKLLCIGI